MTDTDDCSAGAPARGHDGRFVPGGPGGPGRPRGSRNRLTVLLEQLDEREAMILLRALCAAACLGHAGPAKLLFNARVMRRFFTRAASEPSNRCK